MLTNKKLQGIYNALSILGNRRMATANADLKVGRMLRKIAPQAEPITKARRRLFLDLTEAKKPEELAGLAHTVFQYQVAEKLDVFDAEEVVDLQLPSGQITKEDLPREMAGEDGWKNAAGLGAITSDLDILYSDVNEE